MTDLELKIFVFNSACIPRIVTTKVQCGRAVPKASLGGPTYVLLLPASASIPGTSPALRPKSWFRAASRYCNPLMKIGLMKVHAVRYFFYDAYNNKW